MTSWKRLLVTLSLLAVAVPVAAELTVLYPRDATLSADDKIKVFAVVPGGGPPTDVKVNGQAASKLEGEQFRKGEAALAQGLNVLDVGGKTLRVFRLAGSKMAQFRFTPDGGGQQVVFQAFTLHAALDEGCEACHTIEGVRLAAKEQKEACYACHADFGAAEGGKQTFLHAPVAAGECTGCHDPHFASRPKLQKLEKGCNECHDAPPDGGTIHYPVKNGQCTACHGAHAGPAPKQLIKPGNALCLGCHETSHAQHRSTAVKGKLTQVPDDFPRENDELACLGCHKAHHSEERRLFRIPQGKLCQTCHLV